jgi:flagellar basal-body rod modification protein FlgD
MRIDETAAAVTAPNPLSQSSSAPIGSPNEFLRLFIAQLQNQNPLDPQDGAEFVAQLAQFSAVEQAAQTNQRLGEILAGQMSASNAALAGFVGHNGTIAADTFTVSGRGEGVPGLGVELAQPASSVEVVIRDAAGTQIRRFELGPQAAGRVTIPWDGTSQTGAPLVHGTYQVTVTATATDGSPATGNPVMTGLIQAIDFIDGVPRLRLGAVSAAPSDILSIE